MYLLFAKDFIAKSSYSSCTISEDLNLPPGYIASYLTSSPYVFSFWLSKASALAQYPEIYPAYVNKQLFVYPKNGTDRSSCETFFKPFGVFPDSIYLAETEKIVAAMIQQKNYLTTDFCRNGTTLLYPSFRSEPQLVLKPSSNDFPKIHFMLIYKESAEKFYSPIADYLTSNFFL